MDMSHMSSSSSSMDMAASSATSTAMSDMSSMSGMGSMSMVFTTVHNTPLYSNAWTPTSTGAYAGTCIFLIVLAILSRLMQAWRHTLEQKFHDRAMNRRYVVVRGEQEGEQDADQLPDQTEAAKEKSERHAILTSRGLDEKVRVITAKSRSKETAPWRISTDVPRACVFTIQAGLGYLLMLAVMTLNVGYFLSVLAGLFVGELAIGRYAALVEDHH